MSALLRALLPAALALPGAAAAADALLTIASTTSTENSGLYDHLLPLYEARAGVRFRVVAVGTGQAIRNAMRGDADLLIAHHRESEERFVAEGYGLARHDLMYNDFVLVGPAADPAGAAAAGGAAAAFGRIAAARAPYVSRGDDSGTHKRERELWAAAGVDVAPPSGRWYWEAGSGMGATLNVAAGRGAYVLSDRATWAAFGNRGRAARAARGRSRAAQPVRRDPGQPGAPPARARRPGAGTSSPGCCRPEGQAAIAAFRISGQQMFFPNARPAPAATPARPDPSSARRMKKRRAARAAPDQPEPRAAQFRRPRRAAAEAHAETLQQPLRGAHRALAAALVGAQRARDVRRAARQLLRQHGGVQQPEVLPQARERMHGVRRVAEQRRREPAHQRGAKPRPSGSKPPLAMQPHAAQAVAERRGQFRRERVVIEFHQFAGAARSTTPANNAG